MNFIRRTVHNGCIMIGDTKLDISCKLGHLKEAYEGKDVHFGFRPEAIVLGEQKDAYVLNATVELTEMLGDNTNVYVNIADANAILKVNPHDTPATDSEIVFSIPMESVYLFDSETENVIDLEAEAVAAK